MSVARSPLDPCGSIGSNAAVRGFHASLLLPAIVALGCAAKGPVLVDLPARAAADCAAHELRTAVAVGLCVGLAAEEASAVLGKDPAELGLLPVALVVENRTSDRSLLFDPARVTLHGGGPLVGEGEAGAELRADADRLKSAAIVAVVPYVGLAAAVPIAVAEARRREDLLAVTYQAFVAAPRLQTLSPGERTGGLLLVSAPAVPTGTRSIALELVLVDLGSGAEERVALSAPLPDPGAAP